MLLCGKCPGYMKNISIYVGTYGKYNSGSLAGAWLNVNDYESEADFYAACRELHSDEAEPEFMFQDFENMPDNMAGECWINSELWEMAADLAALSDTEAEAYEAFCSLCSSGDDLSVDRFRDCYMGEWESEEDFATQYADDCCLFGDCPDFVRRYFDYSAFARDLFFDFDFVDGFVFDLNR